MVVPGPGGDSLTRSPERRTVNFNLCSRPEACRCDVRGEIVRGRDTQIVAGLESLRVAELRLRNVGSEPSPTAKLEVRLDQPGYRLDLQDWTCNWETETGAKLSLCYLYLENNTQTNINLLLSPSQTVQAGDLTLSVSLSPDCQGGPRHIQAEWRIPVVHQWELRPSQDQTQNYQELYWTTEEDNAEARPVSLQYALTNTGPSTSSLADVFVFLAQDPLVENTEVTLDNLQCSTGNVHHVERLPPTTSQPGDITCVLPGSCLLYHCRVGSSLQRLEEKVVTLSFDFNMKKAEQRNQQTKFVVRTSLCVLKRDQFQPNHIVCEADPTNSTITTTTVFQYFQQSPLDVLIDSWQIVVGAGAALIVFIIVLLLAWKFDLFHRARIIKNREENEETSASQKMEMENIMR